MKPWLKILVVVRHVARERHVGRHRRVVAVVVGQRRQVEPGQEGHDDDRVDQPGAPAAQPGQQLRVDPRPPGGGPRRGCPARRRPLGLLGGGQFRLLPPPGAAAPQPDRDRGREPAEQDSQDGRGDEAGLERARRAGVAVVRVDGDREVGRDRAREGSERRRQRVDVGERADRLGGGLRVGRDVLDLVGVGLAEPRCELAEGPAVAAHGHPGLPPRPRRRSSPRRGAAPRRCPGRRCARSPRRRAPAPTAPCRRSRSTSGTSS